MSQCVIAALAFQLVPILALGQTTELRRIVVVGSDSADSRFDAAREAVEFWNGVFGELRLEHPFATLRFVQLELSEELLNAYSQAVLQRGSYPRAPVDLLELPADIVMALSDAEIVSFAAPLGRRGRRLIGIRTDSLPPLSLPNVARNLVAHELGHVLGLGHNNDPTKLMCGRPAPCRPSAFQSAEPRFFDLTSEERARLSQLYGAGHHTSRPNERMNLPGGVGSG
jgi:hypothetical protein